MLLAFLSMQGPSINPGDSRMFSRATQKQLTSIAIQCDLRGIAVSQFEFKQSAFLIGR